ncbi:hypothetical protein [Alkalibacillus salilacus]|uniref:Uncharacterized protein n=1 Tax=Alkalibacillus salilacus TaxID=284582 RepID=A0ABT9VFS2_9BACI|nr:hypothetical protein [Alkalibacillus salilacus]MDQ0159645.1 hypothetical protein [Alkalibacillus salilacus]
MKRRQVFLVFIVFIIVLLTGCSNNENSAQSQESVGDDKSGEQASTSDELLYDHEDMGLSVGYEKGWEMIEESKDPVNVTFQHDHILSVLTVLSGNKEVQTLKDELLQGANKASVVDESDRFIAYETDREESMRTEVYFMDDKEKTVMLSFVTAKDKYESVEKDITSFRSQLNY